MPRGVGEPGASALTALYHPLDEYRFAPALIRRSGAEPLVRDALRKLVELTRMLRLRIVYAGVDHEAERALIEQLGGYYAEGRAYRPALTPQAVERWLQAGMR